MQCSKQGHHKMTNSARLSCRTQNSNNSSNSWQKSLSLTKVSVAPWPQRSAYQPGEVPGCHSPPPAEQPAITLQWPHLAGRIMKFKFWNQFIASFHFYVSNKVTKEQMKRSNCRIRLNSPFIQELPRRNKWNNWTWDNFIVRKAANVFVFIQSRHPSIAWRIEAVRSWQHQATKRSSNKRVRSATKYCRPQFGKMNNSKHCKNILHPPRRFSVRCWTTNARPHEMFMRFHHTKHEQNVCQ